MGHPEKQLIFEHKNKNIMNIIKKTYGPSLLGLAVIGTAFSMSAFTESNSSSARLAEEIYVNSSSGEYTPLSGAYDPNNCQENSTNTCAWQRTEKPGSVPSTFSASQADDLKAQGLIVEMDAKKGVYIP